ncbi:hypothetical protein BDV40DRAFT_251125 [Aspergillus tamarii]|uniref:Uncharacterized protein n=1 Tax=Aspergillus tamarii TaxID=41984 RepID=A0A5N6VC36_ASPTM|nr:hypothetical protein BDV40DRAFT_251125 [Aspergillus tamarii]
MLLKRPDDFDDLDDERKAEIKYQIFKLTLFQLYFIEPEEKNPILAKNAPYGPRENEVSAIGICR